jgi:RNA polymerase sigma-70 factor (ECF subfamily)
LDDRKSLQWEQALVARAKRGDRSAFGELYDAYAGDLYRKILMPRLGNAQAAEDALAETFRSAIERIDAFEHREISIFHWLSRIAHNKAMDMHRARAVTGRRIADLRVLLEPLSAPQDGADRQFELAAQSSEVHGLVSRVLGELNPRYRRAIELRFFEERSREECAADLDVKLGTFDVVLLRALRAFRTRWEEVTKTGKEDEHAGPLQATALSRA